MNKRGLESVKKCLKPVAGLIGLLVIVVWTTGVFTEKVAPGVLDHPRGLSLPEQAVVLEVVVQDRAGQIEVTGTAASDHMAYLSSRINAHVAEVLVSAGEQVAAGQLLVRLDARELEAQREAARAALHQAETEYERIRRLHAQQTVTERELIAAESAYQAAQARMEQANVAMTFTEIRSPLDGMVADRRAEVGMLAHPGERLLNVFDPTRMRLDVPVPVRLVDHLELGASVQVHLERPDQLVQGRIHRVVGEIDPRSRTQMVQIMLEPGDARILPGTFGRLRIATDSRPLIRIPVDAVHRVGQLEQVHLIQGDRVVRRLIRTGRSENGEVEVLSGLAANDQILLNYMN